MIRPSDCRKAVERIEETTAAGASAPKACQGLGISLRTYQRWIAEGCIKTDGRPHAERPTPANKLYFTAL